jgi:hypothetical protein
MSHGEGISVSGNSMLYRMAMAEMASGWLPASGGGIHALHQIQKKGGNTGQSAFPPFLSSPKKIDWIPK